LPRLDKKGETMSFRKAVLIAVGILCFAVVVVAEEKKGAEKITLNGGSMGNINFPHKGHQDGLKDCKICHDMFAQQPGIIAKLKADKTFKEKQVMNTLCLKCHKEKKEAGLKGGPTSCSECHVK
jgi:hypothetical protein